MTLNLRRDWPVIVEGAIWSLALIWVFRTIVKLAGSAL